MNTNTTKQMTKKGEKELNMNKHEKLGREAWDAHRSHIIHGRPQIQSALVIAPLNRRRYNVQKSATGCSAPLLHHYNML